MAITTMDGLVTALSASQIVPFYKAAATAKAAGAYHSLWRIAGEPSAGATPATGNGEAPTKDTAGAIPFTNPTGGNTLYIGRATFNSATAGNFMLYDRLVQNSGLVGNTTSPQDFESAALTRYTTGEGCRLFIEWYTTTGTGTPTCAVTYTNQAGTASKTATSPVWVASPAVGQMLNVPLAAGDTGIRSVQSVTMSVATGSAGNFGIVILKPLLDFPITVANNAVFFDAISCGLPMITSDACLAWMLIATATAQSVSMGQINLVQG